MRTTFGAALSPLLLLALLMGLAGCSPAVSPVPAPLSDPPSAALSDPLPFSLPYTEVEAESGRSSGAYSDYGTALHTPAAEASQRRYVSLDPGQQLELVAPVAADSLVVRYSLADASDGSVHNAQLTVAVGSADPLTLAITSQYSQDYGTPAWGGTSVWHGLPADGLPRHFWDEANLRTGPLAQGTTVLFTNPFTADSAVLIDLVDFEAIGAAVVQPAGSVSFADSAPDNTGVLDVTAKFNQALAAAQGGVLYVPEGIYRIGSVDVSGVTVQGAGLWRTRFVGAQSRFHFTGGVAHLADFAVWGETHTRNDLSDADNAFSGNPGSGTTLERLWVEHKKCAYWVGNWGNTTGPSGLTIADCRFRDLMADGVNLCSGTTGTTISGCLVRNSGDDGLAAWSPTSGGPSGGNNTISGNLVQLPWVASGIALYGGGPFTVTGNLVKDTVTTGSGIYVSANFGAYAFTGAIDVSNNVLVRAGAHESDPGGPTGAIRVLAGDRDMSAQFTFTDNTIDSPLESAVSIQGPYTISNLTFTGLTIDDAAWAVDVRSNAKGQATFSGVTVTGTKAGGWRNSGGSAFTVVN